MKVYITFPDRPSSHRAARAIAPPKTQKKNWNHACEQAFARGAGCVGNFSNSKGLRNTLLRGHGRFPVFFAYMLSKFPSNGGRQFVFVGKLFSDVCALDPITGRTTVSRARVPNQRGFSCEHYPATFHGKGDKLIYAT
jgi:hypothetical protein